MNLPNETSTAPPPFVRRKWYLMPSVILGGFGLLLIGILCFFAFNVSPERKLVWLTPGEFRFATQPGPFTRMKYKIMNLTGPLLRSFWRIRPRVDIETLLVTRLAGDNEETDLGTPIATNIDGLRAW